MTQLKDAVERVRRQLEMTGNLTGMYSTRLTKCRTADLRTILHALEKEGK
jgi:hypothetical protein